MAELVHTHPCDTCGTPVYCDGVLEQNVDGWPPIICPLYDLPGGERATIECPSCAQTSESDEDEDEDEDEDDD